MKYCLKIISSCKEFLMKELVTKMSLTGKEKNARLKMENSRLKMQVLEYHMRKRKMLWRLLLLFFVVIGITFVVGGEK